MIHGARSTSLTLKEKESLRMQRIKMSSKPVSQANKIPTLTCANKILLKVRTSLALVCVVIYFYFIVRFVSYLIPFLFRIVSFCSPLASVSLLVWHLPPQPHPCWVCSGGLLHQSGCLHFVSVFCFYYEKKCYWGRCGL